MNLKFIILTIFYYCFFMLNNGSGVISQPCYHIIDILTFTIESSVNVNQTAVDYNPCYNDQKLSTSFGIEDSILTVFNVVYDSGNSLLLLTQDFQATTYNLLACSIITGKCNTIGSIKYSVQYYDQGTLFVLVNKVAYFTAQNTPKGLSYTVSLDFKNEKFDLIPLNTDSTPTKLPIQTYNEINNKMYVAFSTPTSSSGSSETSINILEYSVGSPTHSQTIYQNIQNVNDYQMLFTDGNNQLYILGWTNVTSVKDQGWISVCRVDFIKLNCVNVLNQYIGTDGYPYSPYTISNDGSQLIFVTYTDNKPLNNELLLTFFNIDENFSQYKYIINDRWNATDTHFTWFLF